jgi:hypothetical protein
MYLRILMSEAKFKRKLLWSHKPIKLAALFMHQHHNITKAALLSWHLQVRLAAIKLAAKPSCDA